MANIFTGSHQQVNVDFATLHKELSAELAGKLMNDTPDLDKLVEQYSQDVSRFFQEKVAKAQGTQDLIVALSEAVTPDAAEHGGWIDMGIQSKDAKLGIFGQFTEKALFGRGGNSGERMDIVGKLIDDVAGVKNVDFELKTFTNLPKSVIDIGNISVMVNAIDDINYETELILYKMLIKMNNFALVSLSSGDFGGGARIRFNFIELYTNLVVEYVRTLITDYFHSTEGTQSAMKTYGKSFKDSGGLIQIKKSEVKDTKFDPYVTYRIELQYTRFKQSEKNRQTGEVKYAYKNLYRSKLELFNSPEQRRLFFAAVRKIAKITDNIV